MDKELVKRTYAESELREMRDTLPLKVQEVYDLKSEKLQSNTALTASIKDAEARVASLVAALNLGYVVEEVEVLYLFDDPSPGKKKVVRADTSDVLRIEEMTPRERQQTFGFQEPDERPEK
jgi:hypothetical protein